MKPRILVVEDAPDQQLIIKALLSSQYELDLCKSSSEAKEMLSQHSFDLLLIDVVLSGDESGFELAAHLKSTMGETAPAIIFLTGKSSSSSKVLGFSLGAADYIVKPYDPQELKARVDAKIRLIKKRNPDSLHVGDLTLLVNEQRVFREAHGTKTEISLTSHEFKILHLLSRSIHSTVSREQILNVAWGASLYVEGRNVDTHISHIRKKLKGSSVSIRAIYGEGYRLEVKRSTLESA